MKYFTCVIFTITTIILFAQNDEGQSCAKRRENHHPHYRSNLLSIEQIAETEKYDVNYYFLDLNMTNLVTTLSGTVTINASAKEFIDTVLFELFETMTITDLRLNGTTVTYIHENSAVKVLTNLPQGTNFSVEIDYNGTPPTAATNPLGGAGLTNASSPTWGNQVTWSLSEPFSAFEWFPCKQSLKDKADSVDVHLTVPSTCKGGSNGTLEAVVDLGNGTSRYEWKHRHKIDYYLISVAVAEYIDYSYYAYPAGTTDSVLIQNYIYNNPSTLLNFQADIDETGDFMELFSDIYGLYPYMDEKYGHCMAPLGGGMEHQTMTTQGSFSKGLTSHELAHQWFGDHVTCASWADIWVNEGFASYSEYIMKENMYPNETTSDMANRHQSVMSQPDGSVYCLDSLNEGRIFSGRLTYNKGASIIHTMRYFLNNDEQFFQALNDYQTQFADSVAVGLDVKDVLENASGLDLTNLFEEWYFGEGYPTYSAKWNMTGDILSIEVSQTTSAPSITPLFTTPLEIKFARASGGDTTIRFDIQNIVNTYNLQGIGEITSILALDPNNGIINATGAIVHDTNFVASIEEHQHEELISLAPNPSTGIFNISTNKKGTNSLKVYNPQGKLIHQESFNGNTILSLEKFNSGNYFLEVQTENQENTIRKILVKQ
jgi:aminopeptidase N